MDISFVKNNTLLFIGLIVTIVAIGSCNPDLDYTVKGYTQKIIVEGFVESGKHPNVYLSLNVPLWKTLDSTTVLEHVIRYAKVTISDGNVTEVLTSKWDNTHFPPYVYQATEMVGVEGATYDLKVEYSGYTVYSTTFLPFATNIDSVEYNPSPVSDTLRVLSVWLSIDKNKGTGFRLFTKKQRDKRYIETPLLFNEKLQLSGIHKFNLSPYPNKNDSTYTEGKYFSVGDTVDIRICAIDSISTGFFKDISMFSALAGNIFNNEVKPLKSNISEPGFGIWYGSAVRYYRCVIK